MLVVDMQNRYSGLYLARSNKSKREAKAEYIPPDPGPEKPPERHINGYAIGAGIIGVAIGGAIGFFLTIGLVPIYIVVLCTVGGVILAGLLGVYLGEFVGKIAAERKEEDRRR